MQEQRRRVGEEEDAISRPLTEKAGIDRLSALHMVIALVQRGGTILLSGVYGGAASPMRSSRFRHTDHPAHGLDRRHPAAGLRRRRPLGTERFATHHVPLERAPHAYEVFQRKQDIAFKVLVRL